MLKDDLGEKQTMTKRLFIADPVKGRFIDSELLST